MIAEFLIFVNFVLLRVEHSILQTGSLYSLTQVWGGTYSFGSIRKIFTVITSGDAYVGNVCSFSMGGPLQKE